MVGFCAVIVVRVLLFCPLNASYRSDFPCLPLLPIKIILVIGHFTLTYCCLTTKTGWRWDLCCVSLLLIWVIFPSGLWLSLWLIPLSSAEVIETDFFSVAKSTTFSLRIESRVLHIWGKLPTTELYPQSIVSPFPCVSFPKNHCIDFCLPLTVGQDLNHLLKLFMSRPII